MILKRLFAMWTPFEFLSVFGSTALMKLEIVYLKEQLFLPRMRNILNTKKPAPGKEIKICEKNGNVKV